VIYDKEKPFAGKMMVLDSTKMKNDGCRIPPRLSVYSHLGRKQITSNSFSDGLHEIHVLAEAESYADAQKTWHYDLNDKATTIGQEPGGSWLQLAVPAVEPQLQGPD